VISQSLGFELDEKKINEASNFFVRRVEAGSPSAVAGLKEGDKITKINGKSTSGMSFEDFLGEVAIAQQIHERHNMIHLMVMRRTQKDKSSTSQPASATIEVTSSSSVQQAQQSSSSFVSSSTSSALPKDAKPSQECSETSTSSNVSVVKIAQTVPAEGKYFCFL
jgi:C-terminal processing protease CtpA/Prc